jgi:hypothetical protein
LYGSAPVSDDEIHNFWPDFVHDLGTWVGLPTFSIVERRRRVARVRLAERVTRLAAEVHLPVETFAERLLQGLVDADIEIRDGIPLFRMPPDAPVLTSAEVDRLLHRDAQS